MRRPHPDVAQRHKKGALFKIDIENDLGPGSSVVRYALSRTA
jgi:hypothetical protein